MADCELCRLEASTEEPPGGWVLRTDLWSACVAPGFEVPGWLFLQLRRHAEGPMGMDDTEASELGPLLSRVAAGIQAATGAERVYAVAFGEVFPHFHVLLLPRMPFAPAEETGPALLARRPELCDPAAAADTATRVCAAVSSMP